MTSIEWQQKLDDLMFGAFASMAQSMKKVVRLSRALRQTPNKSWHEILKDEPSHWKAEPDAVKDDHELRHSRPLRQR